MNSLQYRVGVEAGAAMKAAGLSVVSSILDLLASDPTGRRCPVGHIHHADSARESNSSPWH